MFSEQGILLNDVAQSSTYTSLYYINIDKDNNLYVGITATGEDSKGYIHKVTPTSQLAWGNSGISLGNGKAYDIKFFQTDHSGIYLTYSDVNMGEISIPLFNHLTFIALIRLGYAVAHLGNNQIITDLFPDFGCCFPTNSGSQCGIF